MRRYHHILAVILLLATACERQEFPMQAVQDDSSNSPAPLLVSEVGCMTRSVKDWSDAALAAMYDLPGKNGDLLGDYKPADIINIGRSLFGQAYWQWQQHTFLYRTVDAFGKPIVLSGQMSFFADTTRQERSRIRTVSLYHLPYSVVVEDMLMTNSAVSLVRPIYGAMVVMPHGQGACYDRNNYRPHTESLLFARQDIDCELAAMELLEQLGYKLSDDYYTENMGISNGGTVAIAVQKLLETTEPREVTDRIRLRATYSGEGAMDYGSNLTDLIKVAVTKPDDFHHSPICITLSFINSLFRSHPDEFAGCVPADYFCDEFNAMTMECDGKPCSLFDAFNKGCYSADSLFEAFSITSIHQVLSKELFDSQDCLDLTHPLVKRLINAFSYNDLNGGWTPKTPIRLVHCINDSYIPYETVRESFDKLHTLPDGSFNDNVSMKTIAHLEHVYAGIFLMLRDIVLKPHPCPVDNH